MATATEEQTEIVVAPWGIEIDHPRNCDVVIQCIPGCRLRGAIDPQRSAIDAKTGMAVVPVDQVTYLAMCPKLPGQQLFLNPMRKEYIILDPLEGNEKLLDRLHNWAKSKNLVSDQNKYRGLPERKGTLHTDSIKTLCREMYRLVEAGEAKVCKGSLPDMEEIDRLPGEYLLNPGAQVRTGQPRYEKDLDEWETRLYARGG